MTGLLHHVLHPAASGRGPALLLIHPLGADHRFWDACLPAWTPRVACLAVDLRGAGHSPGTGTLPTLADHAAELEALRTSLGIDRVVPVGCAVGAMVAATYAARYPDHTAALVMANPTAYSVPAAREMLHARARTVRAEGIAAILPEALDRAFAEQPRDARYDAYYAAFAAQDPMAYADAVESFATADARGDMPKVRCPVLLVPARHDLLLPPALADEVRSLLPPGARLELDEDGAHFLPYQRPERFARRVLDFLTPLPAAPMPQGNTQG